MAHANSNNKTLLVFFILHSLFIILITSCSSDSDSGQIETHEEQIIGVETMRWTYYSLETGSVIGLSDFGDEEVDERWRVRKDWDIALCGELIRTNSGTSGVGEGGIIAIDDSDLPIAAVSLLNRNDARAVADVIA